MGKGRKLQSAIKIRRTKLVQTRVSEDEFQEFERFCSVLDVSVSEGLRRAVSCCCGDGAMLTAEEREMFLKVAEEFRAIGVNLNQMARAMNTGRVPDQIELRQDLVDLMQGMLALGNDLARQGARARRYVAYGGAKPGKQSDV